jgi:FdhD protein
MKKILITCFDRGKRRKKTDWLTEEVTLTIYANKKKVAQLLASPKDLKALALGHLYTSGIIKQLSDIKALSIDSKKGIARAQVRHSAFSVKKKNDFSRVSVKPAKMIELMQRFHKSCKEFIKTGGVHSAALCAKDKILLFKADLGRHNAFDKVAGEALLKGMEFKDKIILTSGRIPSEILNKVLMCRIPIIASVSAPTIHAVRTARKQNITLIGFLRGQKMNIYSADQRIK